MFVAVWPDEETAAGLSELVDRVSRPDGLRMVRAVDWHVTLRFLGDVEVDRVPLVADGVRQAALAVSSAVTCAIGPATAWFSGGRVLQLPVTGLDRLVGEVRTATIPVVPAAGRGEPFSGHLTLGRARGRGLDRSAQAAVAGIAFSARFDVPSIDLVSSESTAEGLRYGTVMRARIAGP